MTHQEGIIHCLVAILSQNREVINSYRRGNPFDKLLRSYDEFNAQGQRLYKTERAKNHYKMSVQAFRSNLPVKELYGEHRIPLSIIIERLCESDGSYESVERILDENEVILVLKEEAKSLDGKVSEGGCGLRSKMPENGNCRFEIAGIKFAEQTILNHL